MGLIMKNGIQYPGVGSGEGSGLEISQLDDVKIIPPLKEGDLLVYNKENSKWKNEKGVPFTTIEKEQEVTKYIKFGIDADGNYGYYKDGADTVTPFRSSAEKFKGELIDKKVAISTSNSTCSNTILYTATEDCTFMYAAFITNGDGCYIDVTFNGVKTRVYSSSIGCYPRVVNMVTGDTIEIYAYGCMNGTSNSSASIIAYKYKKINFTDILWKQGAHPTTWLSTGSSNNHHNYTYTVEQDGYILYGLGVGRDYSTGYIKLNGEMIDWTGYGYGIAGGLYPVKENDVIEVFTWGQVGASTSLSTLCLVI